MAGQEKGGDQMLRVSEASALLGISAKTLRKWTAEGRVNAGRLPGRGDRRYTLGEIQRVRRDVMGVEE